MDRKEEFHIVYLNISERRNNNVRCKASKDLRWCSHDDNNGAMIDSFAIGFMLAYGLESISIGRYIPSVKIHP